MIQTSKTRDADLSKAMHCLTAQKANNNEISGLGSQAAFGRARSEYLKGILRWDPVQLSSIMQFKLQGSYPESCILVTFSAKEEDRVVCRSKIDPTAYRLRAGGMKKLSQAAAACLKKSVGDILRRLTFTPLRCRTEIGPLLCQIDLRIARMEQLASEVSDLERKYDTEVSFVNGRVSFEVEFTKCRASFEVKTTYPFEPMGVRIDVVNTTIDGRKLKRHLVKQAKPGQRYLSRLCDCMDNYLGSLAESLRGS